MSCILRDLQAVHELYTQGGLAVSAVANAFPDSILDGGEKPHVP